MANTNRTKGHNAERKYMRVFKKLGFPDVVTARYGSRLHDDAGIDLLNLPINVQVKAGKQRGMNISDELKYVKERVKELFPKTASEQSNPVILIHEKEVGQGKKRAEEHSIVSMTFEDFIKIFKKVEKW